jgi:CRISPR system Cascade subunit CasE
MNDSVYLSRVRLDVRSRSVRRDLADVHQLHRTIMRQFTAGGGNRAEQGVLFRLESPRGSGPVLLLQSIYEPMWTLDAGYATQRPATKEITPALAAIARNRLLRFRLRANPTRRPAAHDRRNAPRIPLTTWEDRICWLARKLGEAGATLKVCDVAPQARDTGRTEAHRVTIWPVLYDGVLEVIDPDRFRAGIVSGIGPARAYGNGLLSVAPV